MHSSACATRSRSLAAEETSHGHKRITQQPPADADSAAGKDGGSGKQAFRKRSQSQKGFGSSSHSRHSIADGVTGRQRPQCNPCCASSRSTSRSTSRTTIHPPSGARSFAAEEQRSWNEGDCLKPPADADSAAGTSGDGCEPGLRERCLQLVDRSEKLRQEKATTRRSREQLPKQQVSRQPRPGGSPLGRVIVASVPTLVPESNSRGSISRGYHV